MTAQAVELVPPPPRWRLGFFLLGLRLPAEHGAWVADQVATYGGVRRVLALRSVIGVIGLALWALLIRSPELAGAMVGSALAPQLFVARGRTLILRQQGVDGLGRPVPLRGMARLSNTATWLLTLAVVALVVVGVTRLG